MIVTIDMVQTHLEVTDLDFVYNGKPYGICPIGDMTSFIANDRKYDTFDDLLNNFMIEGKPFKDVLKDIEW